MIGFLHHAWHQDVHILGLDFALLLLHIRISGQNFLFRHPSFNYCKRFPLLEEFFALESTYCYTQNHTCITQLSFSRIIFLCVIVLDNQAHETSCNYSFLGYTANIFGGTLFKRHAKPQMITQKYCWEYCNDFVKNVWILHVFRLISGLNLHNPCVESSWRCLFKCIGSLLGEPKGKTRTH